MNAVVRDDSADFSSKRRVSYKNKTTGEQFLPFILGHAFQFFSEHEEFTGRFLNIFGHDGVVPGGASPSEIFFSSTFVRSDAPRTPPQLACIPMQCNQLDQHPSLDGRFQSEEEDCIGFDQT